MAPAPVRDAPGVPGRARLRPRRRSGRRRLLLARTAGDLVVERIGARPRQARPCRGSGVGRRGRGSSAPRALHRGDVLGTAGDARLSGTAADPRDRVVGHPRVGDRDGPKGGDTLASGRRPDLTDPVLPDDLPSAPPLPPPTQLLTSRPDRGRGLSRSRASTAPDRRGVVAGAPPRWPRPDVVEKGPGRAASRARPPESGPGRGGSSRDRSADHESTTPATDGRMGPAVAARRRARPVPSRDPRGRRGPLDVR